MAKFSFWRVNTDKQTQQTTSTKFQANLTLLKLAIFLKGFYGLQFMGVTAVLTNGGSVTADTNIGLTNIGCPSSLIDGIFSMIVDTTSTPTYCLAHNQPIGANGYFDIQLAYPSIVQTVLIINREDLTAETRIIGSDLWVGMASDSLVACGASPQGSGIYSCGGMQGKHVRLQQTRQDYLNIGEIRAYSLSPDSLQLSGYSLVTSATNSLCDQTQSLFDWPKSGGLPITKIINPTTCNQGLLGQVSSQPYYLVSFNLIRFVHAITFVGFSNLSTFQSSQNWQVTCLTQTGFSVCGAFNNTVDSFGKEIAIGENLTGIQIQRNDYSQDLAFFWIGIFTTATDCSGRASPVFDWTESRVDWPTELNESSVVTGTIKASLGDCPVAFTLTQPINSGYAAYNHLTKQLTITSPVPQAQLIVEVTAYSNYGKDVFTGTFTRSFLVRQCSFTLQPPTNSFTFEVTGTQQSFETPKPTSMPQTPNVTLNLTTILTGASLVGGTSVNYFNLSGETVVIEPTVVPGSYSLQFTSSDSNCMKTITYTTTVNVFECKLVLGFSLSPSSFQVILGNPAVNILWAQDSQDARCGSYSATVDPSYAFPVSIAGHQITVQPSTIAGTQQVQFTLTRDNNNSQTAVATLQINGIDCAPSGFVLIPANISVKYLARPTTVKWTQEPKDAICGAYQIIPDPMIGPLMTIINGDLSVESTLASQVGSQLFTVTLERQANTTQKATASFQVTVYCASLAFTELADFTEVNVNNQPIRIPFEVDVPCNNAVTFTLATQQPFLSLESVTGSGGIIKISDATGRMHNQYRLSLTATTSAESINKDFTVFINGCTATTIEHQKIPNVEIFKQVEQQSGVISLDPFTHSLGLLVGADCGVFNQTLLLAKGDPAPSWVVFDQTKNTIRYDVSSVAEASTTQLNLRVSLQDYPQVQAFLPFNITVASSKIICNELQPIQYQIFDPPAAVSISYSNQTFATSTKLTKFVRPIITNFNGDYKPQFIKYYNDQFTLFSQSISDEGSYELGLKVGYEEFPSQAVDCMVALTVKYTAQFIGDQINDQQVSCTLPWSLKLPPYTDQTGKLAKIAVNLGLATQYLTYDAETNVISSDPSKIAGTADAVKIEMTLTDSFFRTSQKTFKLTVDCSSTYPPVTMPQNKTVEFKQELPKLIPRIKKITSLGLMRVEFSKPIILPSFNIYPELHPQDECEGQCQRRLDKQTVKSQSAEAVEILNQAKFKNNETYSPLIDVQVQPGQYSNETALSFKWECTDFQPTYLHIQLNFTNSEFVSIFSERDQIQLSFPGYQYFQSSDGQTLPLDTIVVKSIAPQSQESWGQKLLLVTNTVKNSTKSIIVLNFILKLLISQSLQQLFGAINKLQIMTHLLFINVALPSNAWVFFTSLVSLVNFDIIDTEPISRKILRLYLDHPFTDKFDELGYGSTFFIINMGMLLYAFIGFILGLLLIPILAKINYSRAQTLKTKLRQSLIWSTFIDYFNESYLVTAMSFLISVPSWTFKNAGEFISQDFAYISIVVLIGVPLFKLIYLQRHRSRLQTSAFKEKFESLYETIRYKHSRWALLEPFLTDIRRLILAIALICLANYPICQLIIAFLQIMAVTVFNGEVQPFCDKTHSVMEQFNEFMVALIFYHLLCFADFVPDPNILLQVGWSMIGSAAFCLLVNFTLVLYGAIQDIITKFKRWRKNRKKKLQMERRQRIDEGRQKQMLNYYEEQKKEQDETTRHIHVEASMRQLNEQQILQHKQIPMFVTFYPTANVQQQSDKQNQPKLLTPFKTNLKIEHNTINRPESIQKQEEPIIPDQVSARSRWEQRSSFFRPDHSSQQQ